MSGKVDYKFGGQILTVKTEGRYATSEFLDAIQAAFNLQKMPIHVAVILDFRKSNNNHTEEDYQRIMDCLVVHADRIKCLACMTLFSR